VSANVNVRILLFARLAEMAGVRQQTLDLHPGARVRDACIALESNARGLEHILPVIRIARNGQIVSLDQELHDGDELALLPPVGGG
jgi:molybdopterin converting factor small subunit